MAQKKSDLVTSVTLEIITEHNCSPLTYLQTLPMPLMRNTNISKSRNVSVVVGDLSEDYFREQDVLVQS